MYVVYVAGPYRSHHGGWGVRKNIERAMDVARHLWLGGFAVICPHANTAHMDGANGSTDEVFLAGDFEILRRCDALIVLPGWPFSAGTRREIAVAQKARIPVFWWEDLGLRDPAAACADYQARIKAAQQSDAGLGGGE